VPASECLVVEDAPAGAAASRAAGMHLLAVTTTHGAAELEPADIIVPDLTHVSVRVIERGEGPGVGRTRLEIRSAD
jgi:mannitol-1-/sugar-/sorbitol-6-phosphatase